jgi:uncharacterized membrane protein YcaP (DUF421 family)
MDSDLFHSLLAFDWQGMLVPSLSVAEKVVRTVLVYGFLIVALRLAGKRELAQLNPFDFIVLLVLSNTLQNAVIGPDNSVVGGFLGAATLLLVNAGVNRWLSQHPGLESLLIGKKRVLVSGGRVLPEALARESLTEQELEAAAREQGLGSLDAAESVEIDPDGRLVIVGGRDPGADRHQQLLDRIDSLSGEVERLRTELSLRR